jgi:GNAT superfamily N-acetyltransferase
MSDGSMRTRLATEADAEQLFPMARQLATSFEVDRDGFDQVLAESLTGDHCAVFVAEDDDAIHGYLLGFDHPAFFANGRVAWVEEVFVAEQSRRRGIGAMLMRTFEQWSLERDVKVVALATRRAAPLYLALGYEDSATYFRKLL